jgi:N utilization substance protein B
MQSLYAWDCTKVEQIGPDLEEIKIHLTELDEIIATNAPKWPIDKINKIDLAILRCALWELRYHSDTPTKVVIDEAVELAKEFGTETSSSFVNGVLGSIIKTDEPTS